MAQWDEQGQQLLNQGSQAWEQGNRLEAERLFNQLVEDYPERPEGYNKVGVILAQTGQLEQAEKYFLRAIAQDRMHAPALTNLGNIYLERGETEQAIQHYLLALQSDPEYPPAHRNLGVAYRRQGKYSAFVSHFKRSQKLDSRRSREELRKNRPQLPKGGHMVQPPPYLWWIIAGVGVVIILTVFHR